MTPGAEERGVVQLEVLVPVQRHHREPVAAADDPELVRERMREPAGAVDVRLLRGPVVAVEDRHLVAVRARRPARSSRW